MFDEILIKNCSPTLAGIKVGALFNFGFTSKSDLYSDIRSLNRRINKKGVIAIPLKIRCDKALIYVFRPDQLRIAFLDIKVQKILVSFGYCPDKINMCIRHMISRLENSDFPHEIGLFLGYPPEDVQGFIENRGKNFKTCGFWKVYGDEIKCNKIFSQYKNCTKCYLNAFRSGHTIERLTIAV